MSGALLLLAAGGDPFIEAPNVDDIVSGGAPQTATLSWTNGGLITSSVGTIDQWMTPAVSALAGQYEIKFELSAGSTPSGSSMSTWHNLGSGATLTFVQGVPGTSSGNGTYIIRRASGAELDNGTWGLSATAS